MLVKHKPSVLLSWSIAFEIVAVLITKRPCARFKVHKNLQHEFSSGVNRVTVGVINTAGLKRIACPNSSPGSYAEASLGGRNA